MQLNAKLIRHFLRAKYRSSGGVSVLDVAQGNIFTEYLCDFTLGGASAVPWQLYYVYMENRTTQWVMCSIQTSK